MRTLQWFLGVLRGIKHHEIKLREGSLMSEELVS